MAQKSLLDLHERFTTEAKIKNYSKRTIYWYNDVFKRFLWHSWVSQLSQVSTEIIENYLFEWKTKKNWTVSTYINYRKSLNSFFTWCYKKKLIEENPVSEIVKPQLEKPLPKFISKENAVKVLDYSFNSKYKFQFEKYRNRALLWIMLYTGLRRNETLDLYLNDIDLQANVIYVRKGKWNEIANL